MRLLHHENRQSKLWQHLPDGQALGQHAVTVSLARWQCQRERLRDNPGPIGVRLHGPDRVEDLLEDLALIPLIVIDMQIFTDGRAFSQIRLLRERFGYGGEIRVRGNFLLDQIDAFLRAGADSFELPDDIDDAEAIAALRDGRVRYQPRAPTHPLCLDRGRLVIH